MSRLRFTKMHGLGNDFILVDNREGKSKKLELIAQRLCHRRFGIGADQLLVLENSDLADYRMGIYNSDGSQAQMCGNGLRCLARYIWGRGLSEAEPLKIETLAGIVSPQRVNNLIEVDMGAPILEGAKIPVRQRGKIVSAPLALTGAQFNITCVSMGNPHCVILVDKLEGLAVAEYGPQIERHPLFPERTNVEFVQVINPQQLKLRVWERGAGETPACGTGACASVVASVLNHKTKRQVEVHLPGGMLEVFWSPENDHVYMRGSAEEVFEGSIEIND